MDCLICFHSYNLNFRRPKCLPCGHTICLECVQNPGLNGKCPTCRQEFASNPGSFPDNFALTQIMEKSSKTAGLKQHLQMSIRAGQSVVQLLQQLVPVTVDRLNRLIDSSVAQLCQMEEDLSKLENEEEEGQFKEPDLLQRRLELEERLRLLLNKNCTMVREEEGGTFTCSRPSGAAVLSDSTEAGTAVLSDSTEAGTADATLALLLLIREAEFPKVQLGVDPAVNMPYVGPPPTWTPVLSITSSDLERDSLNVKKIFGDKDRWKYVRRLDNLQGKGSERLLRVMAPYLEELSISPSATTPSVMEEVRMMRSLRRLVARCDKSLQGYPDLPLQLEGLDIINPTENQLRCLQRMPSLRCLAVRDYEGPEVRFPPAQHARLLRLEVPFSVQCKTTMLSLIRAYAPSLQELHIFVDCTVDQALLDEMLILGGGNLTYADWPGLVVSLAESGLSDLRRLVLMRPGGCDKLDACLVQRWAIRDSLPTRVDVTCQNCMVTLH